MRINMKQTVEEAALEHQNSLETCEYDGTISGFINGKKSQSRVSFIAGAEWQSKQSPWISVEEKLPPTGVDVIHTNIDTGRIYYGPINKVGALILGYTPYGEITATHYMVVPKFPFDDILEANKDVLKRIKEKGD